MFDKLLIANRGEIACRIARTARRLGVRTVAVHSDADASAAHVAACDEAVRIGGARPQDSYLRGEVILEAARRTGAQALHPGYGFLSENAGFARACAVAGVVFIGPSPEAIAAMGSKSAAKALMGRTGVPLTPGYHGDRQDDDYLLEQACHVGFPVLIKAVSGGGGKGMRRVDRAADFSAALAGCRREALASFADQRVLVEQFVTPARHIEVQVFGDGRGGGVYLFERDCSVQRRHQKVLEEAPAPGMTPERRRRMGEAAVAAAGAVNYAGAGTVEFIVAADGEFYFMEMNTRLQVEHAVTEMITGVDLVEWQLRMAAGEPMPLRQAELAIHGHAIEARIYAEDPGRDFLPSIGRLEYLATPATDADLRIDTGVRQGDEITPFYDPMLAKLIAHGATREAAIARLQTALAGFHVAGVQTNREFLGRLITSPSFLAPQLDTGLIAREHEHLFPHLDPPADEIWQRAAWASLVLPSGGTSPWDDIGGWRPGGRAERLVTLRWRDSQRALRIGFSSKPAPAADVAVVRAANAVHVFAGPQHHQFQIVDPYLPRFEVGDRHDGLIAPMPGRIIAINVAVGDAVTRGMPLVVMEAMKMEHTVTAPADGAVDRILCAVGEQVREGVELLVLRAAE
jgi:3-methylcrotonyl-CoA carboxylase alpha subunit